MSVLRFTYSVRRCFSLENIVLGSSAILLDSRSLNKLKDGDRKSNMDQDNHGKPQWDFFRTRHGAVVSTDGLLKGLSSEKKQEAPQL